MKSLEIIVRDLLQSTTETEVLEYKEAKNQYDKDKLGKYFSALSNEANLKGKASAWLLFGVNNQKQVVGTTISDTQLNNYKSEMANHTSPTLSFTNVHRLVVEGKTVIMLQIPPAPQGMPVAWKGLYYGRDGESLGGLNIQEIEQIRFQAKHSDWSANIVSKAKFSDLLPEAVMAARTNFKTKNPILVADVDTWDDITFLNKARITIENKITNAAILLLGKPESLHYIQPAVAQISWILKDKDNIELDYEHFTIPLLLNTDMVLQKIRNLNYRYLPDNTLFPIEITQYEPYVIREALHNCIAHQDYTMQQRINLVEFPEHLIFENAGSFIPQSVENVIEQDAPQRHYRNKLLCDAMVSLGMIDSIGSGIKRMFAFQKKRFFPMPDYLLDNKEEVKVKIFGKIIDKNYTQLLINNLDLSLKTAILLDKIQKKQVVSDDEVTQLKSLGLIEGRKPHYYITAKVAAITGQKAVYSRNKAFNKQYYLDLIIKAITEHGSLTRKDIDDLLSDKLSDISTEKQKKIKINNLISELRLKGTITNIGTYKAPIWVLISSKNN